MAHFAGWGTSEPSQGFWAYLGPPWGHPWGSGLVPRSMGGQQKNTNFQFFSTFKLTKTSILPNCQVSNGYFLLVLNFRNLNISGLLGDLERNVFTVRCLYYYNAAGQPKASPRPAQNQPKTSPKPVQNQPKTCTNLKLC
jgi:hypothetical protein